METEFYSYKTGHYFRTSTRFSGWIATILSFMLVLNGSVATWFFLPVGILIQFTFNRVEFDLLNRLYREGISLFGLTFGKMLHLPGIEFLYLNRNNYSQVAESRGSMSRFQRVKYDGYIKLADNTKLHLLQEESREKALQRIEKIAADLGIVFRDRSTIMQ